MKVVKWKVLFMYLVSFFPPSVSTRYLEVLLMRVACNPGQIVFSPSRKAFVTVSQGDGPMLAAEEYADLTGGQGLLGDDAHVYELFIKFAVDASIHFCKLHNQKANKKKINSYTKD